MLSFCLLISLLMLFNKTAIAERENNSGSRWQSSEITCLNEKYSLTVFLLTTNYGLFANNDNFFKIWPFDQFYQKLCTLWKNEFPKVLAEKHLQKSLFEGVVFVNFYKCLSQICLSYAALYNQKLKLDCALFSNKVEIERYHPLKFVISRRGGSVACFVEIPSHIIWNLIFALIVQRAFFRYFFN